MREPNLCFPSSNKAAVCITSALYDRRALDCTASLPLINSLTHLAYLTSTSPRIREILVMDGGLERLVRMMAPQHVEAGRRHLWKWSLAFQCVVNIGVRGTEHIRTKVVDAGMIPIVLRVLENFLKALEIVRREADKGSEPTRALYSPDWYSDSRTNRPVMLDPLAVGYHSYVNMVNASSSSSSSPSDPSPVDTSNSSNPNQASPAPPSSSSASSSSIPSSPSQNQSIDPSDASTNHKRRVIRRSTFPYRKPTVAQRRKQRLGRDPSIKSVPSWQDAQQPTIDNVFYREEDILLSLQLLAYLSKYPHIRDLFHTAYSKNVFSVVEQFCHRRHPNPIQYWAGVIMRNACRKDETKGGIRRCANMHCGKWESQPRDFAKCRRCRKAKYCCKACQSRAWADGHRWWCIERHASSVPQPESANAQALAAATAAVITANPAQVATTLAQGTTTATSTNTTATAAAIDASGSAAPTITQQQQPLDHQTQSTTAASPSTADESVTNHVHGDPPAPQPAQASHDARIDLAPRSSDDTNRQLLMDMEVSMEL
ncbi:hypothetical protein BC940DRAFT_322429 [Gongronella butleri]|nr:hypothetical protein BC940DRAFT_322429 [Gongronella butleri]